jgi:hypothetical protein
MSPYGRHMGNYCCSGRKLVPLSREEALHWAESHLDAEEIEAKFADDGPRCGGAPSV